MPNHTIASPGSQLVRILPPILLTGFFWWLFRTERRELVITVDPSLQADLEAIQDAAHQPSRSMTAEAYGVDDVNDPVPSGYASDLTTRF